MENAKVIQNTKIIKFFLTIILSSILLAISAKIKIPFYPVPMTMQTFIVLLLGVCFGYKIAVASVGLYLLEGIFGLPVFSNSPEKGVGLAYFTGPTMGYLIGFVVTAYLAGKFNYDNNLIKNFLKLVFATSFIYILGILWLGGIIGWDKPVFELGVQPFLLAELFKILIATLVAVKIIKLRNIL